MQYPRSLMLAGLALSAAAGGAVPSPVATDERVFTDPKGRIIARPLPVEERFRNPWPAAWEDAFWDRANASLRATDVAPGKYGGTFFENEKASYPNAFIGFLKGQRTEAVKFLQQDDSEPWSRRLTLGVDWFPSFTIKSQTRKYFFFGFGTDLCQDRQGFIVSDAGKRVFARPVGLPIRRLEDQRHRVHVRQAPELGGSAQGEVAALHDAWSSDHHQGMAGSDRNTADGDRAAAQGLLLAATSSALRCAFHGKTNQTYEKES